MKRQKNRVLFGLAIVLIPIVAIFLSFFCGRYPVSPSQVFSVIFQGDKASPKDYTVIVFLRIPRAIAAAATGAGLAASVVAYQGVFRNPLVNSGLLGVSSGAAFGAALSIVFFQGYALTNISAFVFGIIAVALSYTIASVYRSVPTIMLILGGTIVSSVFSSLLTLLKFTADTSDQLPAIVYWTMGSVSSTEYKDLWALIPISLGLLILAICANRINLLSVGEKEAGTMGVNVRLSKMVIIIAATLSTAGAVCLAGAVGWVGLIIPHIGRMVVGNDNKILLPVTISIGMTFMIFVDTISRSIATTEIPLGVLTSLIGAPFFVFLLKKSRGGGWT